MNRWKQLSVGVVASALVLSGAAVGASAMPGDPGTTSEAGKRAKVKVTSAPSSFVYGTPAGVTGKVKIKGKKKHKVMLQWKLPGRGWKTVAKDKTNRKGAYAIMVPGTFFHPGIKYRVAVKKTRLKKKVGKISVLPNYTPIGTPDSWARISNQAKFQYNPCAPINYRVNLGGLDAQAFADVQEAIARVEAASGLNYKYKGTTTAVPFDGNKRNHPKNTNLVIAFATDEETEESFLNASAWGGTEKAVWARSAKFGKVALNKQTGVVVDKLATYITPGADGYRADVGYSVSRVQLLQHELGHAAGLGHRLDRPGEIMSYNASYTWGQGDLTGLSKVGLASGCVKPIRTNRRAGVDGDNFFAPPVVVMD